MTDTTSPSINDVVRQHAYRSYEETETFQEDLDDVSTVVVGSEMTPEGPIGVTLGETIGGSASHVGREALKIGFERGYSSRDAHFDNLDVAYGELVANVSDLQGTLLVYSQIVAKVTERLAEQDAKQLIPLHILADLDQIVTEGMMMLTGALDDGSGLEDDLETLFKQ